MQRRRAMQLLAASATSLWAGRQISASSPFVERLQDLAPPELVPLFPLDLVLLPHTNLPLHIFEPRYKEMIHDCLQNHWEFGILAVQGQSVNNIGCTASISDVLNTFPDGRMNILIQGRRRFKIRSLDQQKSYLRGESEFLDDDDATPPTEALRQRALELYGRLHELVELENQLLQGPSPVFTDTQLSYRMMAGVPAEIGWKQSLLELRSEPERLVRVMRYFEELTEKLERTPEQPHVPNRKIVRVFPDPH